MVNGLGKIGDLGIGGGLKVIYLFGDRCLEVVVVLGEGGYGVCHGLNKVKDLGVCLGLR